MDESNKKDQLSRRQFVALTGGTIGLAALGSLGLMAAYTENEREVDPADFKYQENETDVLVIGSGMAGLFAAVKAHDAGAKVMMVSKGRLGSSGLTPFAKGIFAYDEKTSDYSLDEFTAMVSRSALGTNNAVYTRQMAEHSLARVNELREWGFFESNLYNKSFNVPITERNIPLIERVVITHLIKENGRIAGASGFSLDEQKIYFFTAKTVILCTGAGGFKPNGFPVCDLTHDGTVMAYQIGAKVTGKEWNDGHPGRSTNPAASYDGWGDMFDQKPSTTQIEIHHDLGVDLNYRAYKLGNPIQMGPPGQEPGQGAELDGGPFVPEEFRRSGPPGGGGERPGGEGRRGEGPGGRGPRGEGGNRERRRPPRKGDGPPGMQGSLAGGSSAGMAIHKSEGIVPINEKCESNIPGLYAAGDALGSYMAGAIYTQVGSSLAGSAVQGAVAGEAAAAFCQKVAMPVISSSTRKNIETQMLAPLKREAGYSPAWVTQTLQGIMIPNFVLYIKKESMLKAALAYIEELRDHHLPMLRAADLHELRLAHETANMIITAEMKLKASILRKESRCSHYRLDYPELDNENWRAWINIYKEEDGSMQFEKQPFGSWPEVI